MLAGSGTALTRTLSSMAPWLSPPALAKLKLKLPLATGVKTRLALCQGALAAALARVNVLLALPKLTSTVSLPALRRLPAMSKLSV